MHLPSPFYDGKYHPSLLGSCVLRLFDNAKVEKKSGPYEKVALIFSTITPIKCAISLFWPLIHPPSHDTSHRERNNQQGTPQRIAVLHENPGILCIYWE